MGIYSGHLYRVPGERQKYFRDLAAMTCDSCVSPPSRIGQEPPSIGPYKD